MVKLQMFRLCTLQANVYDALSRCYVNNSYHTVNAGTNTCYVHTYKSYWAVFPVY